MNVTLTPELERIVNAQLATGQFATREEVVRAALLQFEQQYAALRADIAERMEDLTHGRVAPLDVSATLARVRSRAKADPHHHGGTRPRSDTRRAGCTQPGER